MIRPSRVRVCIALLVAVFFAHEVGAQTEDSVFTADLPFDAGQRIPVWMHGPPVAAPGSGSRVAFSLSPPAGRDLLVHFVYDETSDTGLRVEWLRDGSGSPIVISPNLGDGITGPNQRSLLISASNLGGNGTLLIQGSSTMNLNRVRFEWVAERTMLAADSRYVPVVVTASRLTLAEADVDGGPRPALADEWSDRVVRAALTEKSEPLTPSITLVTDLEQAPVRARFEALLSGVYFDQEVWLIVNEQEVGPLGIDVPDLRDPGHLGLPGREMQFAGWRKANIFVPAHLLLPGENSIHLELRSPVNSGYRNKTFLRDAVLELRYPAPPREPDLSMPLRDLPGDTSDTGGAADEPLPPVSTKAASPGDLLKDYWSKDGGSL